MNNPSTPLLWIIAGLALPFASAGTISNCTTVAGGVISCVGSLDTPEDFFEESFTVTAPRISSITIQTYGFGGGTNAEGASIPAGGFDSLVALFSNAPEEVLTDAAGTPVASVSGTTQFFPGCPPAGTISIGSASICGDNQLVITLPPGSYSLVLSDANYIPFAVSPGPPLSSALADGFADLSGGVFETCTTDGACVQDTGNFAVDILGLSSPTAPTPEPATIWLLTVGVAVLSGIRMQRQP
jgi:hypothetical protein